MRKILLAAMFVGVVGLLSAGTAVAADYPPSCDSTTDITGVTSPPSSDSGSQTCASASTNGDPTLFVAGASGQGNQNALAFTGSDTTPLVLVGAAAVLLGGVLVVATRRRAVQNS